MLLEETRDFLGIDANACILHNDCDHSRAAVHLRLMVHVNQNRALHGELDCVRDVVHEHLLHSGTISHDAAGDDRVALHRDLGPIELSLFLLREDHFFDFLSDVNYKAADLESASLEQIEVQQVIDSHSESLGTRVDVQEDLFVVLARNVLLQNVDH